MPITVMARRSIGDSSCRIDLMEPNADQATPPAARLGCKHRREILVAYAKVLDSHSTSVKPSSSLPYSKRLIREAILEEMLEAPETEERPRFALAYAQLESFLGPKEFKLVERFHRVKSIAERMVRSGNPLDILAAGELVKRFPGDRVVAIFERVSNRMRSRLAEVRRLSLPVIAS